MFGVLEATLHCVPINQRSQPNPKPGRHQNPVASLRNTRDSHHTTQEPSPFNSKAKGNSNSKGPFQKEGQPVVPGFGVMAENRGYYLFWGPAGLCVIWKLKVSIVR